MNYLGLLGEYPTKRPLSDVEVERRLAQKKNIAITPTHQLSTIKINSIFIELVDKYFAWKGFFSIFAIIVIVMMFMMIVLTLLITSMRPTGLSGAMGVIGFVFVMCIPFICFFFIKIKKRIFRLHSLPYTLKP